MSCVKVFDLPVAEKRAEELRKLTEQPDFWTSDKAQDVSRELAQVETGLDKFNLIKNEIEELETVIELLNETDDAELSEEFNLRSGQISKQMEAYQILVLLDGEYDTSDTIVMVHSGAGGLDSQDWALMLYRMYIRWAEDHQYKIKIIDELADPEAGIKTVTFTVSGEYAYGYLKGEQGVHRLVRISPFDTAKRRHTSFASVEVMPVLADDTAIEIRPEDLKMDTFRASGAGGQYVNMTDSAVRITHIPTGFVVSCQTERSQHMNRATAMQLLRGKLFDKQMKERQQQLDNIQGEKRAIAWGSQIRSYTLQPFQLVKDHRSLLEVGNVNAVLDGEIDMFIMDYLRWLKTGTTNGGEK